MDSCRKANQGEVSSQEWIETTATLGFVNVINAFHVVNQGDTPVRFFNDDRKTRGGITLTDEFFYLAEGGQFNNLPQEVEARWNLFLPHVLIDGREIRNLDGVWNLVLACQTCNRSKLARAPQVKYLTRLNTRNNYLITSHHPLRGTLIRQTGDTDPDRHSFLNRSYQVAVDTLIHTWGPTEKFGTAV